MFAPAHFMSAEYWSMCQIKSRHNFFFYRQGKLADGEYFSPITSNVEWEYRVEVQYFQTTRVAAKIYSSHGESAY